ncbi:MAG: cytidine deaminase, partial [Ancalomicrobiaceae bacterium]|nr:cytidine deaminase [Ancalomicrobiaceae bacterium]
MSQLHELFAAAAAARPKAYAPYSRFHVGAAILCADGAVYSGCNIENAAYPEGTCAEAGAIAHMVMGGATKIAEIAIVGGPAGAAEILCPPCGGCRQKIREFGGLMAKVHLRDETGTVRSFALQDLLPVSFGPESL